MPTVQSKNATLYYEVHGNGPTIVFAHGAGGNTLIWWQQVAHFAREHQVITFDHRGFGRSACALDAFHPKYFAADLLAILDDAEVDRAALVCQSMGGWTGLRTAVSHPDRVRALVLCGTPGGLMIEPIQAGMMAAGARLAELTAQGEDPTVHFVVGPEFPTQEPARTLLYSQINELNPPRDPQLLSVLLEPHVRPEEFDGYGVPTLLLICEHDAFFPPAAMREVAALIPGSATYEFDGSGHSSYWEQPERFNRVVGEFLAPHLSA